MSVQALLIELEAEFDKLRIERMVAAGMTHSEAFKVLELEGPPPSR